MPAEVALVGDGKAIVGQLNKALESFEYMYPADTPWHKAIAEKSIQEALFKTATDVGGGTPDQLAKIARDDAEKYKKIVSEVNIKLT